MKTPANPTGSEAQLLIETVHVSSAELLDMHNTVVELLPEPGGRFYYAPLNFILHYRHVTTPYNENQRNDFGIGFGSTIPEVTDTANLIQPLAVAVGTGALFTYTEDTYVLPPLAFGTGFGLAYWWPKDTIENKALGLGSFAALTGGDGTLTVRIWYSLINGAPPA